ncbi:MAG: hypothetical protein HYV28_20420 [Ignavibacteriales bacterium]|nr:hypothetical protein [Ignavibacteriales bacterium]
MKNGARYKRPRCPNCGKNYFERDKYCGNCGKKVLFNRNSRERGGNEDNNASSQTKSIFLIPHCVIQIFREKTLWVAISVISGSLLVVIVLTITAAPRLIWPNHSNISGDHASFSDPVASKIMQKFVCNCGSCSGEDLVLCECKTAKDERTLIRKRIHQGVDEKSVIEEVNNKFGGRKTDS